MLSEPVSCDGESSGESDAVTQPPLEGGVPSGYRLAKRDPMSDTGKDGISMWPPRPQDEKSSSSKPCAEEEDASRRLKIDEEITRAELGRAEELLARVERGPTHSIRAAFAGEARDTYDAAMRRLERLRGTQAEESLKLASLRVRLLLEAAEQGHALLPHPPT